MVRRGQSPLRRLSLTASDSPAEQRHLQHRMHCFNSSDPVAVNATLMFDFNNDNENLWIRGIQDAPLPPCSSSSTPLDSQCTVCLDQLVRAVCRNLTDGVKVMMEAGGHPVKISKSECPTPPFDDGPQWPLPVALIFILILFIIILIACWFKHKKCCNSRSEDRKSRHMKMSPPTPSSPLM